jgi:Predicted membrane protein
MDIKDIAGKIALVVGFGLMFGIMIGGQGFRDSVGLSVNFIFHPLADILTASNLHILILILSALTGLYTALIQKYTIDWDLMKRFQTKMKKFQMEYKKAQLSGDKERLMKLGEESKKTMEESVEMQKQQLKPMGYISIVTIPLFMWLYVYLSEVYGVYGWGAVSTSITGPSFIFPFFGSKLLVDAVFWGFQWWLLWYFVCSLFFGQIFMKALNTGMSM